MGGAARMAGTVARGGAGSKRRRTKKGRMVAHPPLIRSLEAAYAASCWPSASASATGPLSRPLAPTSRSTSSITAMSAASP